MKDAIKNRLTKAIVAVVASTGGGAALYTNSTPDKPSAAVLLAYEVAVHFESGGKHIGKPYVDKLGAGQPWTVCAGITGPKVDPSRYYTEEDCKALEIPFLIASEKLAIKTFKHWDTYNVWVRVSLIDVAYNVPSAFAPTSSLVKAGNSGDLIGMCRQMPRWVFGTVNGQKVRLPGLVDRRGTTEELCAEWGRDGHFSYEYTKVSSVEHTNCTRSHPVSPSSGPLLWCGYRDRHWLWGGQGVREAWA